MQKTNFKNITFFRLRNESASRISLFLLIIICFGAGWRQTPAQASAVFRNELPFEIADDKFFERRIFNANKNLPDVIFNFENPTATFVVNSTGDGADADTSNNICETVVVGECTLRAAIQQANQTVGADNINFNIPLAGVQTITPAAPLPIITEAVTIDGYTQPLSMANTNPMTIWAAMPFCSLN